MSRSLLILGVLPFAAACVPQVAPPVAPRPAPVVAAPAPPPLSPPPAEVDWQDWPVTPGGWRYAGGTATFGSGSGAALLAVACDRALGQVALTIRPPVTAPTLTVRTTTLARAVPVGSDARMALTARDPLLDAMAFSRGHFSIEQAGRPPLVLPAHPEVGRVIEDCRR